MVPDDIYSSRWNAIHIYLLMDTKRLCNFLLFWKNGCGRGTLTSADIAEPVDVVDLTQESVKRVKRDAMGAKKLNEEQYGYEIQCYDDFPSIVVENTMWMLQERYFCSSGSSRDLYSFCNVTLRQPGFSGFIHEGPSDRKEGTRSASIQEEATTRWSWKKMEGDKLDQCFNSLQRQRVPPML